MCWPSLVQTNVSRAVNVLTKFCANKGIPSCQCVDQVLCKQRYPELSMCWPSLVQTRVSRVVNVLAKSCANKGIPSCQCADEVG